MLINLTLSHLLGDLGALLGRELDALFLRHNRALLLGQLLADRLRFALFALHGTAELLRVLPALLPRDL